MGGVAGLCAWLTAARAEVPPLTSDDELRQILRPRVDVEKQAIGIVVGRVDAQGGLRIIEYGRTERGGREVDGETLFEIGSVTKVFTSLLLADMVTRGEVKLNDPVAKYLPPEVKISERNGRQITLRDLATQRSGLPRLADNMHPKDPGNPYADYTVPQMYAFLSGYSLTRDIGSQYEYSDLRVTLLGHALERRAGKPYAALVEALVYGSLGLHSTGMTVPPSMRLRLALPHTRDTDTDGELGVRRALPAAGGLRSDAEDLLRFVAANLNPGGCPLGPAIQLTHQRAGGRRQPGSRHRIGLAHREDIRSASLLAQWRHGRVPQLHRVRSGTKARRSGARQRRQQHRRRGVPPTRHPLPVGEARSASDGCTRDAGSIRGSLCCRQSFCLGGLGARIPACSCRRPVRRRWNSPRAPIRSSTSLARTSCFCSHLVAAAPWLLWYYAKWRAASPDQTGGAVAITVRAVYESA